MLYRAIRRAQLVAEHDAVSGVWRIRRDELNRFDTTTRQSQNDRLRLGEDHRRGASAWGRRSRRGDRLPRHRVLAWWLSASERLPEFAYIVTFSGTERDGDKTDLTYPPGGIQGVGARR